MRARCFGTWMIWSASLASMFACQTRPEPSPIQDMTIIPDISAAPSPATEGLARLNEILDGHPKWQESAEALVLALKGQRDFDKRQWDLAQRSYLELLKSESGRLGRMGFENWVKTYQQILKENATPQVLAQLLLAETDSGTTSAYLKDQRLTNLEELKTRIKANMGILVDARMEANPKALVPKMPGRPSDDPLLQRTAQDYCLASDPQAWRGWIRSLSANERAYWQAMVARCQGDQAALENILPNLVERLQESNEAGLAVASVQYLIEVYRAKGERVKTADAYLQLVEAISRQDLKPELLGQSEFEFQHFQINQVLWASRNRALIGDYLTARDFVQRSFRLIDNAYHRNLNNQQKRQLEELRAEGYHILAFRISYEQADFEAALIQNRLGSRITMLNEDWSFRFAWFEAWYQFRAGRVQEAHDQWQKILAEFDRPQDRARVQFWLALSAEQLGQSRTAKRYFDRLCKKHPLSFYSLAAPQLGGVGQWRCRHSSQLAAAAKAAGPARLRKEIDPVSLRRDSELAPLLYRAELAIRADLGELKSWTVDDLHRQLRASRRPAQEFRGYLYASRLLYAAGDFHRAIGLSYELSLVDPDLWKNYPDQFNVFFPAPYLEIFERNAARFYLDPALLLALTRQESTFRAEVLSPAGAIGLMQLMPNTAERYANKLGANPSGGVVGSLGDPEFNIRLGASYLNELSRRYQIKIPKILAAYNAGEYAVDRWAEKRAAEPPLVWIEGIPFGETQSYVKAVIRNWELYRQLIQ